MNEPRDPFPDTVVVGRIGRPHGVRGEVTVEVRTDDPDRRFVPGAVLVGALAKRAVSTTMGFSSPPKPAQKLASSRSFPAGMAL